MIILCRIASWDMIVGYLVLSILLIVRPLGFSAVLLVPSQFPTIQEALDTAFVGDEISISPGIYTENLTFPGINLTLRSVEPTSPTIVQQTIIDGGESGSVITLTGNETAATLISGLTITGGDSDTDGGGISGNGSLATILFSRIEGNRAEFGGGLAKCHGLVRRNTVRANEAFNEGGGLYDCDGEILENVVAGNVVKQHFLVDEDTFGGGMSRCDGTISNNLVVENACLGHRVQLVATSISGGGGIALSTASIRQNRIVRNTVASDYVELLGGLGAGLFACSGEAVENLIEGNYTDGSGGGGYNISGTVESNIVRGNSARRGGGLISNQVYCINNLILFNSASTYGAGMIVSDGRLVNNVFWGNQAGEYTGGIDGYMVTLQNCVIWGNSAPEHPQTTVNVEKVSYCSIQAWDSGGVGNLSLDPQFIDPENGNFELKPTSPLIDAGCYIEDVEYDTLGRPRPILSTDGSRGDGSGFDIGAYEYQDIRIAEPTVGWMLY